MINHNATLEKDGPSSPQVGLSEALDGDWLELCYQPKVDLQNKKLAGAESLARVNHPVHGIVLPGSFLRDADPASLLSLAEFAVLTALRDWSEFADAGAALCLSVNVPITALIKLPIAALVRDHRPQSTSWPGLILEVGEDQIIRDIPLVREFASQLALYNIRIAVDRCGFAPSSFPALMDLPNVEFKLDRSFVIGCGGDPVKRELCESLISQAHKHKRRVVAVGLEKPEDARFFTSIGCDYGQGVLLGPPLEKGKLRQMLRIQSGRKSGPSGLQIAAASARRQAGFLVREAAHAHRV
jgi:EAL domain-containing protein (putative c-di-GMP-specific phosphodiesterase class I)